MAGDVVLENGMSREGLRTLHVVRMGGQPDVEAWRGRLPPAAEDSLTFMRWEEAGLGVRHLLLMWYARERYQLSAVPSRKDAQGAEAASCQPPSTGSRSAREEKKMDCVMWWVGTGQRMSEAIREGCERYFLEFGEDAGVCVVRAAPKGAPKDGRVQVEALGKVVELKLVERGWAPERVIILVKELGWLNEMA